MQRAQAVALFLITTLLLMLPAMVLILQHEKLALHALLNSHHAPAADAFFSVITHMADGWVPTILALVLLLLKDLRSFLMMSLSAAVSALIVQFLKRMVFGTWDRPIRYAEELGEMHWILGLELNHHFSFPSGHATCAFSMCMALAVIAGKRKWAVPLALLAAVLAFSRVYISQHFMEDITAGGLIGTATAAIFYLVLYKGPRSKHERLDKRVFRRQNQ